MRLAGVDFPRRLTEALESDELVVFAGAGVSVGTPANLPNFESLATAIAAGTGEAQQESEPVDRLLGRLTSRGTNVHERAAHELRGGTSEPTALHGDLLRLYRTTQSVRVVTTNFDALFEQAAAHVFDRAPSVFTAPVLPLGNSFSGIVHVHGDLVDHRGMVLTDADFGRAYLTEGVGEALPSGPVSDAHRPVRRLRPRRHGHELPVASPDSGRRRTLRAHRRARQREVATARRRAHRLREVCGRRPQCARRRCPASRRLQPPGAPRLAARHCGDRQEPAAARRRDGGPGSPMPCPTRSDAASSPMPHRMWIGSHGSNDAGIWQRCSGPRAVLDKIKNLRTGVSVGPVAVHSLSAVLTAEHRPSQGPTAAQALSHRCKNIGRSCGRAKRGAPGCIWRSRAEYPSWLPLITSTASVSGSSPGGNTYIARLYYELSS